MVRRMKIVRSLVVVGVVVLAVRLACVQLVWGPELAAHAQSQRTREYTDFARRGMVTDRDGAQLAYTMQARSLTVAPLVLRREITERHELAVRSGDPELLEKNPPLDDVLEEMSEVIPKMVKDAGASVQKVKPTEILEKLRADNSYTVLVRNVDPDVAVEIAERFPGVAADRQDIRQYPNGAIAENVIGKISIDGEGQFGLEAASDAVLSGINGKSTEDVSTNGQIIPGTLRDQVPVVHGSDVRLTLDLNLQTYVQQELEQAKENSRAKSASAVVLDAESGEVLAMANTDTIDPTGDIEAQLARGKFFGNPAVQAPFEPGSVAKIITAATAIEDGVTTPDEVLQVPGSINMSGVTVKDAWPHGVVPFTTTGVFGKSSNVGTLMLADRVGQDRFAEMLDRFGVGRYTGIELPGESPGLLLDRSQWSGGTFANLPIGQGMSLTLLQMAGVYQTIANDGERIEPRIIRSVTTADGEVIEQPEPGRVRVVSPETARTVRDMFQAVTQQDPSGVQQGTGPQAAVEGYRISGKTGTAQQVDPTCNCYSNSDYWITFAGIAPADAPRFVIGIMLDDPERGVHGEGGQSAAPLFHDIAAWLLNRDNVPLSDPLEEDLILQAQ
ncbi:MULTISPECIES: peptidoglycan D,D-transpeptidase FtsI family protein [unclassified Corynebacterium]|uniref:peptidoglycan D,D-transpeptidase FtsI family protein n=1 Tax=unclassified Corynebacterium TaxID=2624378 RepID=UPI003525679B